jgi:hypothetical protein
LEYLAAKALSRIRIAYGTQHEIQRSTSRIHRPVEIIPVLVDPDVRLIHEEHTYGLRDAVVRELDLLTWFLWHGNVYPALQMVESVEMDLDIEA